MKQNYTRTLVVAALMAAMTCTCTMIVKIPIPATGGYINLGDGMVLLSGIVLGPVYGGLSAGLGSALADLLSGYALWAPATFVLKGLMAVVVSLMIKTCAKATFTRTLSAGLLAEFIMVAGYFGYETVIINLTGALVGLAGNAIQGVGGIVVAMIFLPLIRRLNISDLRK